MKLHGTVVPFAAIATNVPTTVLVGALSGTVKLLIVIVMNLSGGRNVARHRNHRCSLSGDRWLSIAIIGASYTHFQKLSSKQQQGKILMHEPTIRAGG
jgi:hypothetical protein